MSVVDSYKMMVLTVANKFADYFVKDDKVIKKLFGTTTAIPKIVLSAYNYTVNANEIEPIENLSDEGKHSLWKESTVYCPDKEKRLRWCKIVWLMMSVTA